MVRSYEEVDEMAKSERVSLREAALLLAVRPGCGGDPRPRGVSVAFGASASDVQPIPRPQKGGKGKTSEGHRRHSRRPSGGPGQPSGYFLSSASQTVSTTSLVTT